MNESRHISTKNGIDSHGQLVMETSLLWRRLFRQCTAADRKRIYRPFCGPMDRVQEADAPPDAPRRIGLASSVPGLKAVEVTANATGRDRSGGCDRSMRSEKGWAEPYAHAGKTPCLRKPRSNTLHDDAATLEAPH